MRGVERLSVPGTPEGVRQALDAFERFGRSRDLPPRGGWRVLVALDEILSNIVRHGLKGRGTPIDVTFSLVEGTVSVEIVDSAEAFNPLCVPAPDTSSPLDQRQPGGLGIALVQGLIDDTRYERRNERNHFVMTWRPDADR